MSDPHDLQRFVDAQDDGNTFERALGELHAGRKTSHWMWFVFPQIAGLGHSPMATRYAIGSLSEARAYAEHPVLGPRLRRSVDALAALDTTDAAAVLGAIDALKLRSCLTLFVHACPAEPRFRDLLERWYGAPDPATEKRLDQGATRLRRP